MSHLPIIPPPQYQQSSTPIINMPNWYYFGSNLIVQRCFLTDLQVITLVDQWLHIWPLNLHIIVLHHHLAESLLIPQGLHCTTLSGLKQNSFSPGSCQLYRYWSCCYQSSNALPLIGVSWQLTMPTSILCLWSYQSCCDCPLYTLALTGIC